METVPPARLERLSVCGYLIYFQILTSLKPRMRTQGDTLAILLLIPLLPESGASGCIDRQEFGSPPPNVLQCCL
jgi:hypothetical protein